MNAEETKLALKKSKLGFGLPPHFWRHVISGTVVFFLGVMMDVIVVHVMEANSLWQPEFKGALD